MNDFNNSQLDLDKLPKYESVVFQRISPNYIKVIWFNIILLNLIIFSVFGVLYYFAEGENRVQLQRLAIIMVPICLVISSFSLLGFKNRQFALREKDIIFQKGFLKLTTIIIPFNRIQHTKVNSGWLSRLFFLQTLSVFTAGGDSASMTIAGLPVDVSDTIKQMIINKIQEEDTLNSD